MPACTPCINDGVAFRTVETRCERHAIVLELSATRGLQIWLPKAKDYVCKCVYELLGSILCSFINYGEPASRTFCRPCHSCRHHSILIMVSTDRCAADQSIKALFIHLFVCFFVGVCNRHVNSGLGLCKWHKGWHERESTWNSSSASDSCLAAVLETFSAVSTSSNAFESAPDFSAMEASSSFRLLSNCNFQVEERIPNGIR